MEKKLSEEKKILKIGFWIVIVIIAGVLIYNNYFNAEARGERYLKKEGGYEVSYFSCQESVSIGTPMVYMKSLGNRNNQVWDVLLRLGVACPNAEKYYVKIIEETQECHYFVDGYILATYLNSLGQGQIDINDERVKGTIDYNMWKIYAKEEVIKQNSGNLDTDFTAVFYYKEMNEKGIIGGVLSSIIDYDIETGHCR